MDNQNLGKGVFSRSFDPNFVSGWGTRPYNWALGLSVQQELLPRVSLNVAYNRSWWGNWYVVDNRSTLAEDYTPFSIYAPVDPRLPGGGGQTISGLYNLAPTNRAGQPLVGKVDGSRNSSNFAEQTENWHGVDLSVVRGCETTDGQRHQHREQGREGCAVRAYCRSWAPAHSVTNEPSRRTSTRRGVHSRSR